MLAADATHKCIWNGYPLLLVGSCDREKRFHPFGAAITTGETEEDYKFLFEALKHTIIKLYDRTITPTILLADGAYSIHNGFRQVFELKRRIMCWSHVSQNFHKKFPKSNRKLKDEVYADICQLQSSITDEMFQKAFKTIYRKMV